MNRILDLQTDRNLRSRGAWDVMSQHRAHVSSLLLASATVDAKLCLLGCGNCNDLDLPALASAYGKIDLVDIDADAVAYGIGEQFPELPAHVESLAPIDVTGSVDLFSKLAAAEQAAAADIDELLNRLAEDADPPCRGPYDVVASICLLSQLIESVTLSLGEAHPKYLPTVQAIRSQHIRLLIDLLRPGGTALLITDFVSTATAPSLPLIAESLLPAVVEQLIHEQNFFTGLNPNVLLNQLHSVPEFSSRLCETSVSPPWIWNFGPKQFAVVALQFRRR